MRKFTVFTVILTVIIVVILSETFVNKYLPGMVRTKAPASDTVVIESPDLPESLDLSRSLQTNLLGADLSLSDLEEVPEVEEDPEVEEVDLDTAFLEGLPIVVDEPGAEGDFESAGFVDFSPTVFVSEEQVKTAGFANAYLEEEDHQGMLYRTIKFEDLLDVEGTKYVVKDTEALYAKVYVFRMGENSQPGEVYEVLKVRAAAGLNIEVNETNDFGVASFYMNDTRRSSVAFLTVRIGDYIYGFSYPKAYHTQIKNLIKLIDLEI